MKKLIICLGIGLLASSAGARGSHYTRSYIRHNGSFVMGHHSTNPDRTRLNNWSTRGNVNPYTGRVGTVNPYQSTGNWQRVGN